MFDIIIPIGPKDKDIFYKQIEYTKKNIIGYRNIYLITYDTSITDKDCITIDENIFPFNLNTIALFHGKRTRNGWYLQQLLKFYAGNIIEGILDTYLVIDTDTFFLKPTHFIENNKCLYNYGREIHNPFFLHLKKLNTNFERIFRYKSGICHHMMIETKYINEIIDIIEKEHNDKFYNVFLKNVDEKDYDYSGASEYELYFNYIFKYHKDKVLIRNLNWRNTKCPSLNKDIIKGFDYVSYHWYLR